MRKDPNESSGETLIVQHSDANNTNNISVDQTTPDEDITELILNKFKAALKNANKKLEGSDNLKLKAQQIQELASLI